MNLSLWNQDNTEYCLDDGSDELEVRSTNGEWLKTHRWDATVLTQASSTNATRREVDRTV